MSIDLSSINGTISSLLNRNSSLNANKDKSNTTTSDTNEQLRAHVQQMMTTRKGLVDYLDNNINDTFTASSDFQNSSILSSISQMKNTTGMSSIEKYKYMLEQAKNASRIDTTEPDAEKLLSQSEKVIQQALSQGISVSDTVNLNRALTAKQIALSRLDMLG